VWMEQRVNPEAVATALPPDFVLDDPLALVYNVYWNPATVFGPGPHDPFVYNELLVVLRVKYKGRPSNFPVMLLMDDDVAMMSTSGCPKRLANFSYSVSRTPGSLVHLHITRRGREVLKISGKMGQPESRSIRGLNDRFSNLFAWVLSHQFPWTSQHQSPNYLFMRSFMTPRPFSQRKIDVSDLKVSWGNSAQEPLGAWFAKEPPANAGFMHVDQGWLPHLVDSPKFDLHKMQLEYPPSLMVTKPVEFGFYEQMPTDQFRNWWLNNYQLSYM